MKNLIKSLCIIGLIFTATSAFADLKPTQKGGEARRTYGFYRDFFADENTIERNYTGQSLFGVSYA